MFWYYVAYVCIVYIDGFKVHWQTIYFGKFTMEETGHFNWPMFEDDSAIRSTLYSKHTLKVHKTWLHISCSYVFLIKVSFVYYMCDYGR